MSLFSLRPEISKKERLAFIAFSLVMAVLYDVFFWDKLVGIGFFLFVLVFILGSTALFIRTKLFRQPWAFLFAILALVMAVTPVIYQNAMVTYGVPWFVGIFLFLFIATAAVTNPHRVPFQLSRIPLIASIDRTLYHWGDVSRDLFSGAGSRHALLKRVALGVLIAVPILFFFGILFYQADEVFAAWVRGINVEFVDFWRLLRTGLLTLAVAGIFYALFVEKYELSQRESKKMDGDAVIVSVVLGLIALLFAVFVFIQIRYLFAGVEYVFAEGITYASYARKGYGELLAAIALSGVIVIGVYRWFSDTSRHAVLTVLQALLVFEVGVVAASALKRLYLYQDAYGFTVIRLYSEWFAYFMLAVMVWTILALVARLAFRHFWTGAMVVGVVSLTLVVCLNVDYIIARRNIDLFLTGEKKEIDFEYLGRLSTDITPALVPLVTSAKFAEYIQTTTNTAPYAYNAPGVNYARLLNTLQMEITKQERAKWPEFHLGLEEAKRVFKPEWRNIILPTHLESAKQFNNYSYGRVEY